MKVPSFLCDPQQIYMLGFFACNCSCGTICTHHPPPLNCNQLTKTTGRQPKPLLHKKVHHSEPEELVLSTRDFHGAPDFVMVHHRCAPSCIPSEPGISNALTIMPTLQNFPPIWAALWLGRPPTEQKWANLNISEYKGAASLSDW